MSCFAPTGDDENRPEGPPESTEGKFYFPLNDRTCPYIFANITFLM